MDGIDRQILAELQGNARLTVTELAERVQLSLSPCHRRLRALESSGAISGYRATLNAQVFGLNFEALVFVTMGVGTRETCTPSRPPSRRSRTSCAPSAYLATPTTCCRSSHATCPPSNGCTTSGWPLSQAFNV